MSRLPALATAVLLSACTLGAPEPVRYEVVRGDTLSLVARAHGVTVDELRAWNGIRGDLIEVGQILLIHAEPPQAGAPVGEPTRSAPAPSGTADPAPTGLAAPTGLVMPAPRPCLAPPSADAVGEHGAVASQGLTEAQVRSAMDAVVPHTLSCVPARSGTVHTEITVGCDGRVAAVRVTDHGNYPPEVVGCVRNVLRHAAFPPHALPDGDTFGYPLRFSF